ncbi:MAG: DivIVA domain-containing protein [Mycoplasmoidaceae bacterium]|nr:DivIVA domain-containing protein [Mycoplasmoidaceae bacterium]
MSNKEMTDKILNKKFKKSVFSGYDCNDVDAYFDQVIEYLLNNDKTVQSYADDIANLKKQVKQLLADKAALQKENAKLNKEIEEYQEEGYGNMLLKQRSQQNK